jgi:ribosomal protein S27E
MSADQGWIILGGVIAIVLVIVLGVPIAKAVQNKLRKGQMRRHFSDTRGLRRRVVENTAPKHSWKFEQYSAADTNRTQPPDRLLDQSRGVRALPKGHRRRDGEITISCPECGYESRSTIAWTRDRMKMQCAGCGDEFYLHKTKIRKALDAVMKAFGHHQ